MKTTLNDRMVKSAKADIADAVVPGFMLRVRQPSGAKSFALLARYPGSPNPTRRTIAAVGAVTLADARETARTWLGLLARGIDPADQRREERTAHAAAQRDTFAAVCERYLIKYVPNLRTAGRIEYYCRQIFIPLWGHVPITKMSWKDISAALDVFEEIGTDHALVRLKARKRLTKPNWAPHPAPKTARNLFMYLDGVFRWAAGTGEYGIDRSPLANVSKEKRFGAAPKRGRFLSENELGAAWLAAGKLTAPHRQFYRMLMLTGLRLSEVREAEWSEFDFKRKEWTIPAERMKGRKTTATSHTVPLTLPMLSLLDEMRGGNRGDFVFSVNGGASPIAKSMKAKGRFDAAMATEYDGKAKEFVNHDFRRTLSTLGAKIGIEPIVVEKMLAHTLRGVMAVYNQHDYLEQRRAAHDKWAAFIFECAGERKPTNVVRLRGRA